MTTYSDTVYSALLTADEPMSSRALYKAHDTFESAEQVNKAVAYLVKQGRAEMVGMEKPKGGKAVRLYRALTPDEQTERAPSAPADLDQQLAAAIRERDAETAEAVIEPLASVVPAVGGEWPDAIEERPVAWSREARSFKPRINASGDPIINAMRRMQIGKPRIQNIETDIRRVRSLADAIGDAGPDVSAWLSELADKLESAA